MRDIVLVTIVLGCALGALRSPVFGILTFVFFGLFNPQGMTWGFGREFPLAMMVAVATMISFAFWSERKRLPFQRESLLLFALWAVFGISTLFAIYTDRAIPFFVYISKVLFMALLMTAIINTPARAHLLLRVIGFALGLLAVKGFVFSVLTGGNFRVFGPEGTFLEGANPLGMAFAMNVPILVYLARTETNAWLRLVFLGMAGASVLSAIFTYSRGAWLAVAMTVGLLMIRHQNKFLLVPATMLAGILAFPLLSVLMPEKLHDKYDELVNYDVDSSAQSRLWNWEFCARVGLAHPMTGGGANFYSLEAYAKYYPEFLDEWPGKVWSCHSMWFTVFGEHGFPGFILWCGLLVSTFLSLQRLKRVQDESPEFGRLRQCARMLEISLASYMVAGTFFDAAYFDLFYELVALVIILKAQIEERPDHTARYSDSEGFRWSFHTRTSGQRRAESLRTIG